MTEEGKAPGSTAPQGGPGAPAPATEAAAQEREAEAAADTRRLEDMTLGELAFDVADRATVLVREEIELAKAEVSEKFDRLVKGSIVGLAAGIFAVLALILLMHSVAWLLNDLLFGGAWWAGFLIEAVIFIAIAVGAGLFAKRSFSEAAPPTPDMAIEQAKEIKADFESGGGTR